MLLGFGLAGAAGNFIASSGDQRWSTVTHERAIGARTFGRGQISRNIQDLGATRVLHLLECWPIATALAAATREEITEFGRAQRTGFLERFADRLQALLAADPANPAVSVCLSALGRPHA